jgi:hypothetical protein
MRVFKMMANDCIYEIEYFHPVGMFHPERLKVSALNFFHPTASPHLSENRFFYITTQSLEGEG